MGRNWISLISIFIAASLIFGNSASWGAAGTDEDLLSDAIGPNVLIILDNSNSMDEDFFGGGIGSYSTGSKSVEGRKVLREIIKTYADNIRIGLMTYRLAAGVTPAYIHNTMYFASYEKKSYCPNPVQACVDFCRDPANLSARAACQSACKGPEPMQNPDFDVDYIDDSISGLAGGPVRDKYCGLIHPKTNRMENWSDLGKYIYYKYTLPAYTYGSPMVDHFEVSCGYVANNVWDDNFQFYLQKKGSSDAVPATCGLADAASGYDAPSGSMTWAPTDSDKALGFFEFGKRTASRYAGSTWALNSSPGGGYLDVPVKENDSMTNVQKTALLAKLEPYESDPTGYMTCTPPGGDYNQCPHVINAGLTPTAGTMKSAIQYFQGTYVSPGGSGVLSPIVSTSVSCQKNFIIYVTDGLPSVDEGGVEKPASDLIPDVATYLGKLRNLSGTAADGFAFSGVDVKTYIVGVGLTSDAKALLDQMAVSGGTDVSGKAYYADNPVQLENALRAIFAGLVPGNYSFSLPSISSLRDENSLYITSLEPIAWEPFWKGHLKKIRIQDNGGLGADLWDAGTQLEGTTDSARDIRTLIGGSFTPFDTAVAESYFEVATPELRNLVVNYIRGKSILTDPVSGTAEPNPDRPRKLGDIYHSNAITIGTPSLFFNDSRDASKAFESFRSGHPRTSLNGKRLVVAGGNDGQLHAFETNGGTEKWSFIPPNLLPKLKTIVHLSHPFFRPHQYFVDGPVSAADAWLPAANDDGTAKSAGDWKTVLVFGLGMGIRNGADADFLWSKSENCDRDFNKKYTAAYQYYCGYYALDVTETAAYPNLQWKKIDHRGSQDADYLGEPWSRMAIGRVKKAGKEVWVGFVGGGYASASDPKAGRGFFMIDLKSGKVLWSYTKQDSLPMNRVAGSPALVDTDSDGFVDTAYVGDLAGNLWKFTFCLREDGASCDTAEWTSRAGRLFKNSANQKIFTTPAVARDYDGNFWVFWGTGNRAYPHRLGPQNSFYAVKDVKAGYRDVPDTCDIGGLQDITAAPGYTDPATYKYGWYLNFDAVGRERVLSDAAVFNGIVFFTTYKAPAAITPWG